MVILNTISLQNTKKTTLQPITLNTTVKISAASFWNQSNTRFKALLAENWAQQQLFFGTTSALKWYTWCMFMFAVWIRLDSILAKASLHAYSRNPQGRTHCYFRAWHSNQCSYTYTLKMLSTVIRIPTPALYKNNYELFTCWLQIDFFCSFYSVFHMD